MGRGEWAGGESGENWGARGESVNLGKRGFRTRWGKWGEWRGVGGSGRSAENSF
jgi:hypothetical protein